MDLLNLLLQTEVLAIKLFIPLAALMLLVKFMKSFF